MIEDPSAVTFYHFWNSNSADSVVTEVLNDVSIWGQDLSHLNGFGEAVANNLNHIINNGMKAALEAYHSKKTIA